MKKPIPKIQKIELTEDDKEDIKRIIEGKPSKDKVKRWEERGHFNYERHYRPSQLETRIKAVREKYFGGLCKICHKFPLYRVVYDMSGAKLLEFYCEQHLDKMKNI